MVIEVAGLNYFYDNKAVLKDVNFTVDEGQIVGILGTNGSGKTTLFNCMQGLRSNYKGNIKIFGYEASARKKAVLSKIGVLFQSNTFFKTITVGDLFKFVSSLYNNVKTKEEIMTILKDLGLENEYNSVFELMSGGQKQKVNLALAVINKPKLLFLDEPTLGIDVQSRQDLWALIKKIKEQGTTVLITTHYIQEIENLCDRVIVINKGVKLLDDNVKKVVSEFKYNKKIIFNNPLGTDLDSFKVALPEDKVVETQTGDIVVFTNDLEATIEVVANTFGCAKHLIPGLRTQNVDLEDIFLATVGSVLELEN